MPPDAQPARTRVRRRLAVALIALAVLILLVVTPPLVSVDRYRHRIVQTMSDTLGRPVHIDEVKLHLLPIPSLELRNVVVSEDPAFGAEPTIRANRVLAILRPSSLWRRRIEFSTIRFTADANGSGPSINLVRNPSGRWNLDSVLMQAAHVSTAPTGQRTPGPAPRFPYIQATAARVNLKLGNEKMPFSLTDTEFALWLPAPDQWNVRLTGRPTRTDRSLSETGVIRLEGTFRRAASMAEVPVDLQGSWTGAQLGEATTLLAGDDMGWRGTGAVQAALAGPLAHAQLTSTFDLHNLRRAEFVPVRQLDLTVTCRAEAAVTEATLQEPVCTLPTPPPPQADPAMAGKEASASSETPYAVDARAARFDLTSRVATGLRLGIHASDAWLMDWARLLSPEVPPEENPDGSIEGSFTAIAGTPRQMAFWAGTLQGTLLGTPPWRKPDELPVRYDFAVTGSPSGFDLAPVNVAAASEPPLDLAGSANGLGYTLHLTGTSDGEHLRQLAATMPPLATGLGPLLTPAPSAAPASSTGPRLPLPPAPQKVEITCSRLWSAPLQTCQVPSRPSVRIQRR